MEQRRTLSGVAAQRFRIAAVLTVLMVVLYFGFVSMVAFAKPTLARKVAPGLTLGILMGALVIVFSWVLTWVYVLWANRHYDPHVDQLREEKQ